MAARDYQVYAAQSIWDFFAKQPTGNPLVLMPTGTGKSHVIAEFCQSVLYYYPQTRIQVVTHVKELIQQDYNKIVEAWPTAPIGIYSAGLGKKDVHNSIVVGGIQSMARKPHLFGHVDLVLVDEAHRLTPEEETDYRKYLDQLKKVNPNVRVIGFTATGFRLGHGLLHEGDNALFTGVAADMCTVEAFNWFVAQGYLIPLVVPRTRLELDVTGVHMRGNEFIQGELQNAVDKQEITRKALREVRERSPERKKWLIFAAGVEHATHIAEELDIMGISCAIVHSKMSDAERDANIRGFKAGKYQALVNNNILTTGFDDPEIDLILCLRPTASAVLWVQMLGRGTRPVWPLRDGSNWHLWPQGAVASGRYDIDTTEGRQLCIIEGPKQNCIVYDFGGNTRRLGPINDPVIPRKKGEKKGEAPVKECEVCGNFAHASVRFCGGVPKDDPRFNPQNGCGSEFSFAVKIKQEASTVGVMNVEEPRVEVFKVDSIFYQQWQRAGKPAMLRVTYYCGLRKFDEYVCLEHPPGYALTKARHWWKKRTDVPPPDTVEVALALSNRLAVTTHINVWVNKKYPDIMDYDFSGTAFKTQEPLLDSAWPTVNSDSKKPTVALVSDNDDDIPF